MRRRRLPEELVEDYKKGVKIKDLYKKYGFAYSTIKNQLIEMGLKKEASWGGRRKGSGRKKAEKGKELERIREKNMKIGHNHRQPEGSRVKTNPIYNVVRSSYYLGG